MVATAVSGYGVAGVGIGAAAREGLRRAGSNDTTSGALMLAQPDALKTTAAPLK